MSGSYWLTDFTLRDKLFKDRQYLLAFFPIRIQADFMRQHIRVIPVSRLLLAGPIRRRMLNDHMWAELFGLFWTLIRTSLDPILSSGLLMSCALRLMAWVTDIVASDDCLPLDHYERHIVRNAQSDGLELGIGRIDIAMRNDPERVPRSLGSRREQMSVCGSFLRHIAVPSSIVKSDLGHKIKWFRARRSVPPSTRTYKDLDGGGLTGLTAGIEIPQITVAEDWQITNLFDSGWRELLD